MKRRLEYSDLAVGVRTVHDDCWFGSVVCSQHQPVDHQGNMAFARFVSPLSARFVVKITMARSPNILYHRLYVGQSSSFFQTRSFSAGSVKTLRERLSEQVPEYRAKLKGIKEKYGKETLGTCTVDQV